jgi:arsenite methyltransferase
MAQDLPVDPDALREQVRGKHREVAANPGASFHFHTGRSLASRLGCDPAEVDALPDRAVEYFAGVGNPFSLLRLAPDEKVVDVGSGGRLQFADIANGRPSQLGRCATSTSGPVE